MLEFSGWGIAHEVLFVTSKFFLHHSAQNKEPCIGNDREFDGLSASVNTF
jgi:hypothetical protein